MARKRKAARPSPRIPGPAPGVRTAELRIPPLALRLAAAALLALFLAHAVLFGMRAVLAERRESSDGMNYISVARNLSAGEGFVQSSPGHNQPRFWDEQFDPDFPSKTRHSHSVGLPLLIFAVAELGGLRPRDAAYAMNAACYGLALALAGALMFYLWGLGAALLAAAAIAWLNNELFFFPMSEPSAVVLMLASLLLLARPGGDWRFAAAGVLAAGSVLVRSAMLPIFGAGALFCLLQGEKRWRALALFAAGCAVFLAERLVGEGTRYVAFHTGVPWDVKIRAIFGQFFRALGPGIAVAAALSALLLWRARNSARKSKRRRGLFAALWSWAEENAARLSLAAWVAGFACSTLLAGIILHIEALDDFREMYPAKIGMAALLGGMAWAALPGRRGRRALALAAAVFIFSLAAGIARDWKAYSQRGDVSDAARIEARETLRWGAENLRADDFVVAPFGILFPYYLERVDSAVSYIGWPYHLEITAAHLRAIVLRRCGAGRHLLFLSKNYGGNGPYLAGLSVKKPAPNMEPLAELERHLIYRMTHCDKG